MNIILEEICLAEKIIGPSLQGKGASKEVRPKYQYPIPIIQSWRLNERHYGALVGLSKEGAERLYGRIRLTRWRDSWDVPPPPMPLEMVKRWGREDHCQPVTIVRVGDGGRTCIFDPAALGMQNLHSSKVSQGSGVRIVEHGGRRRQGIPAESSGPESKDKIIDDATFMPPSESLRDAYERFLPLWIQGIAPHIRAGRTVLVVAHANTIRSILFAIDGEIATKENAKKVKIPSALPLIYEFVDNSGFVGLEKFDEFSGDFSGRRNEAAVGISKPTCPTYVFNGQVCSAVVPGNLRLLKPSVNTATKDANEDFRYRLNGRWVETAETKSASFCTDLGKAMGEQDIA
jgi:bisphosphoglycerate-dependent phosphoglycerate mutase